MYHFILFFSNNQFSKSVWPYAYYNRSTLNFFMTNNNLWFLKSMMIWWRWRIWEEKRILASDKIKKHFILINLGTWTRNMVIYVHTFIYPLYISIYFKGSFTIHFQENHLSRNSLCQPHHITLFTAISYRQLFARQKWKFHF